MVYTPSRVMPVALALTAGLALVLAACGGGGEKAAGNGGGQSNGGPLSFDVTMSDNSFTPDKLTVSEGAQVTFNLKNEGATIHNMRVAGADNQFDNDDDAVADPATAAGGESGTLTWKAPDKSGAIDIRCDYHPQDMTATITVE
jgi:plastocyanin